jgi:DNA ligase-4
VVLGTDISSLINSQDNMGETVDVLVVGSLFILLVSCRLRLMHYTAGNYGTGRRSGGVSALICAVLDDRRRVDEDDELKYSTFIRVGSGMSFADYVEIRSRRWKEYNYANPRERPSWLLASEKGIISEDKGDCYLEPEE